MTTLIRRSSTSPLTELVDWLDSGWPAMADLRREAAHILRIEERTEDDKYVVRAEIPGIDPEKDVEITVADGILTLAAERKETVTEKGRSEFHYGAFTRSVKLPSGAKEDEVAATYADGILQVTVPIVSTQPQPRSIPVARGSNGS